MKLKKLIKLLYPPVWLIIMFIPICTAALIYTFISANEKHPLAYVTYVLSFYTLTVVVMKCVTIIPEHYRSAKQRVYDIPIGERFMTDIKFRTHISLYISLAANVTYASMNFLSGFIYHTAWFFVLAFYYIILAVMRFLLVRFVNHVGIGKNYLKELRRSRVCGYIMLTINLALSGAVLMILYQNKGYEYHGILIYAMAAYTFYITTLAIVNLLKYRKLGSPVMSMSKIINMAAALVSMLSLETAMFSQFGRDMKPENQRLIIMLTGAGVSIVIVAMSVYSIIKNSGKIKRITEEKIYGK